jgi:hypothetical protein
VSTPVSAPPINEPGAMSAAVSKNPGETPRHANRGWIWDDYIPVPFTAILGSINAPTTLVAAFAAAMCAGNEVCV